MFYGQLLEKKSYLWNDEGGDKDVGGGGGWDQQQARTAKVKGHP